MAQSRTPGPLNVPIDAIRVPARTPGPLGFNDQADPNMTTRLGDTPGALGMNDHADPNLAPLTSLPGASAGMQGRSAQGVPISVGHGSGVEGPAVVLTINGLIAAGGPLSQATVLAVNAAAAKTPAQWRRYIAYDQEVKVGGSLAWRANNPGNLRAAASKIATVSGAVGSFAVFASLADGRAAQRQLYLDKYGAMKVKDAINKLTPPSENDTEQYLADLKRAGVDLDKDVKSQIDLLMTAVAANEGLIAGTVVARVT